MSDEHKPDILSDHEYDGIREYDNPMPGWWVAVFWITIIFAGLYMMWYHGSVYGSSVRGEYQAAVEANMLKQLAAFGELKPDAPTLIKLTENEIAMNRGRTIFQSYCIACHGPEGQGLVGPNMTDDAYKNVKVIADIPKVVANGAANGTMPAWKAMLSEPDIIIVSAYVATLRGKNLPGPRPAEGNVIAPWSADEK
ncbi:MAG: c-type cytochrome [Planctomycetes bacterium]|nr:c-type cytochrome [Planctomycetota bacterium]